MKKILVGCPTSDYHEYALQEYAKAIKSLTYKNHDILLVDNSKDDSYLEKLKSLSLPAIKGPYFEGAKQRIISSRNILREKVINGNYDYFLSLEQDVIPPKNILENLLQFKKDIISAVYFIPQNKGLIPMLAVKNQNEEKYFYLPFKFINNSKRIIKVDYVGLGAILISKRVLEKIQFRTDQKPGFDDWWFCKDAKAQGFEIFADLAVKCKHLLSKRNWNWGELKL